jgi:hypothetical protein
MIKTNKILIVDKKGEKTDCVVTQKPKKFKILYDKIKICIKKNKPTIKFIKIYLNVQSVIKLMWDIFIITSFSNTGIIYIMRF